MALTIDDHGWPYSVLMVRVTAEVETLDDVVPQYALSAERYFGPEQGPAWVSTLRGKPMARIPVTPVWVGVLDFKTRFPSALTAGSATSVAGLNAIRGSAAADYDLAVVHDPRDRR